MTQPVLQVNLKLLVRNYKFLRDIIKPATPSAVVKDNAYGLDAAIVAKTLYSEAECYDFWVAHAVEGEKIAPQVPGARIYVLQGIGADSLPLFEKYGFLAIPVVDNEKRLVGIVTIDDAISILQDEASEDIAKMNAIGPSDKPYFKQSMWDLYKSRAPWLLFLMISSTFSSMVIRGYEDALAAVTVLTAYIPMLTDAGGNAGSQSTSTIIRGMAVGDIEPHDLPKILWREFRVAILCGGTLALCNFAKLIFLDGITPPVAAVVCLTLICTVILSQLIGGLLPVIAEKLNFDPAVMASPLITTIVDTTTLLVYFNIARVLLKIYILDTVFIIVNCTAPGWCGTIFF